MNNVAVADDDWWIMLLLFVDDDDGDAEWRCFYYCYCCW